VGVIALAIPDSLAIALAPVILTGILSWVVWVTVSTFRNNDEREHEDTPAPRPSASRREWRARFGEDVTELHERRDDR